jgi:hypothetical protein
MNYELYYRPVRETGQHFRVLARTLVGHLLRNYHRLLGRKVISFAAALAFRTCQTE